MPKAQVVLQQLLRYGLPAIALSVAGRFSFVLLSGNTDVFDIFNKMNATIQRLMECYRLLQEFVLELPVVQMMVHLH